MIINSKLTSEQKRVLFEQGTEAPFSGEFVDHSEAGMYACANCATQLFESTTKYDSTTPGLIGRPSFDKAIPGAVEYRDDNSLGARRTEVVCAKCKSHLGHVFKADDAPTGDHFCINSVCLGFTPKT
jgi:peptide-methionine (R)-S-oxide reductase